MNVQVMNSGSGYDSFSQFCYKNSEENQNYQNFQ